MKIVFVINDLRTGGAERVFSDDANALVARGHEVTMCLLYGSASRDQFALELVPAIRRFELHARSPFDIGALRRFRMLLREAKPDTCLSTLNDANLFARFGLIGMRRVRCIRREANELSMKPWWHRALDLAFDWRTDGVIAVSEHIAAGIRRYDPWVAARVAVLSNAVRIPEAAARDSEPPVRIVAVGSLTPKKDYETLVRACGILKRGGVSFTLAIAGDGPERNPLELLAQSEQVADEVAFVGRLDHDAVGRLYAEASLFVLTSLTEGSPNALLEAMAAGLPCAVSDLPSTREVADESCALFERAGDADAFAQALARLCDDPALRVSMGSRARDIIARRFSPERRIEKLISILAGGSI